MESLSIRVSDYVSSEDNELPRSLEHPNGAFFARPNREPDAVAAAGRAYQEDSHWHYEAGYLFVPASGKAMAGMRVPAAGEAREQSCAVCLEDFESEDQLRIMPCSHSFHQRCIFRWLRISHVCPYCRFPLPSVEEQDLLDEQADREFVRRDQARDD